MRKLLLLLTTPLLIGMTGCSNSDNKPCPDPKPCPTPKPCPACPDIPLYPILPPTQVETDADKLMKWFIVENHNYDNPSDQWDLNSINVILKYDKESINSYHNDDQMKVLNMTLTNPLLIVYHNDNFLYTINKNVIYVNGQSVPNFPFQFSITY